MLRLVHRSVRAYEASCRTHLRGCVGRQAAWRISLLDDARVPTARCSPAFNAPLLLRYHSTAASESALPESLTAEPAPPPPSRPQEATTRDLPLTCPGCGALSQTVDDTIPGYYSPKAKPPPAKRKTSRNFENEIFQRAMRSGAFHDVNSADDNKSATQPSDNNKSTSNDEVPICTRCHELIYQHKGTSIAHPSMQSIRAMIEESPHERNHIYHIVDAADFPMSLISNLTSALNISRMRTRNRRSKSHRHNRLAEVTFIITRSDLLAPKKEQVDAMMPVLREILRDALGRAGKNLRLGNVRCVSAQRGWWTRALKEEIFERGGAGWMVGKVNVGKSGLFGVVYPKGRNGKKDVDIDRLREEERRGKLEAAELEMEMQRMELDSFPVEDVEDLQGEATKESDIAYHQETSSIDLDSTSEDGAKLGLANTPDEPMQPTLEVGQTEAQADSLRESDLIQQTQEAQTDAQLDTNLLPEAQETETPIEANALLDDEEEVIGSLLPPPQEETQYPHMPIVSTLAGTTASPIRIPYGNGKGELIDLPGVERSNLSDYVEVRERKNLIMKGRISPQQYTIKAGQSLLIGGGLMRITSSPKDADLVFLAYPFVPLESHTTSTKKAIAIQTGIAPDVVIETAESPFATETPDEVSSDAKIPNIPTIITEASRAVMQKAGSFKLSWNVTKQRTGSLTNPTAGKWKVADLPFTIYSADILLEGVGWIELVCQVRNWRRQPVREPVREALGLPRRDVFGDIPEGEKYGKRDGKGQEDEFHPEVEVWTPEGKFVDVRRPINAWMLGGPRQVAKHNQRKRPRQTIGMQRRKEGGARGGPRGR